MSTIAVIGTLDSKGEEHAFVAEQIRKLGHEVLLVDVGTLGSPQVIPDISREEVLAVSGICLLYTSPSPRDQRGSRMPSSA